VNPGWQVARVKTGYALDSATYQTRIKFEMTARLYNGYAAIDDILVTDGDCPAVDFCNFEQDLCGYTNEGAFNWERANSSKSTQTTGPTVDHTFGTSEAFFAYIDAAKQKQNDKALLVSPVQARTWGSCIHFYFHARGLDVGALNVMVKRNGGVLSEVLASYKNGGDQWYLSQVTLKSQFEWQAVFEGVVGNGPDGNIALDDIRLSSGECPNVASCDFENQNLCEYSNVLGNDINWLLADLSQIFNSNFEGPIVDHTFGTNKGNYATFNTINSNKDWSGRIESEIVEGGQQAKCFKFYFSMFSSTPSSVGSLKVYVKSQFDEELMWSLSGSQGLKRGEWREGRFSVARTGQYWIVIEGVSTGKRGDISLDDLNLFDSGACKTEPPEADVNGMITGTTTPVVTLTTSRPLSTFSWVSESSFDCNFEDWPCQGWDNEATNDFNFNWIRNRGSNYLTTGPNYDHTYGNSTGYFIYVNVSILCLFLFCFMENFD